MQVKVFKAEDMRSALEKVKKSLGPEALILSTRTISRGRLGLSGKSGIEVTAAVDPDLDEARVSSGGGGYTHPPDPGSCSGRSRAAEGRGEQAADAGLDAGNFDSVLCSFSGGSEENRGEHEQESELFRELREIKRSFRDLASEFSEVRGNWVKQLLEAGPGGESCGNAACTLDARVLSELCELGVDSRVLRMFAESAGSRAEASTRNGEQGLEHLLEEFISGALKLEDPISGSWEGQKRLAFIGPTGVGKTTTMAKVAADYLFRKGGRLVLATIDNYRIAAAEQLKIYGRIMNVPVEVARSPEDLSGIFRRHRDADLILVDTAGRSPRSESGQKELAGFLGPETGTENYLLLSATTRQGDLYSVIERFSHVGLRGLIVTKLDECDQPGQVLNLGLHSGHCLSFLTNGQKVPEDLIRPEPYWFARTILNRDEVAHKWITRETGIRQGSCVN